MERGGIILSFHCGFIANRKAVLSAVTDASSGQAFFKYTNLQVIRSISTTSPRLESHRIPAVFFSSVLQSAVLTLMDQKSHFTESCLYHRAP